MKVIARNLFERPVILLFLTLTCLIPFSPFIQACDDTDDCSSESAACAAASAALIGVADRLDGARSRLDAARSEFDRLSRERDSALSDHRAALTRRDTDRRALVRARRDAGLGVSGVIAGLLCPEIGAIELVMLLASLGAATVYTGEEGALRRDLIADEIAVRDTKARYDSARRAVWPAESEFSTATSLFDSARAAYDTARAAYKSAAAALSSCSS